MADTVRTRSALLTLLADNTSRDISPQDMRDVLVSVHGVYGGLYVQDGSTLENVTSAAKMTGWAGNMASAGTTPDHTDDSIEVGTDGIYLIWHQMSCLTATASVTFQGHLRIDGVEQVEGWHQKFGATSEENQVGFVALKSLSSGEKITVYLECSGVGTLTPVDAQLVCFRVA